MTKTTNPMVSLCEFWDLLNRHDWFSCMANGHDFWKGAREGEVLCDIATSSPVHRALFEQFSDYAWSDLVDWRTGERKLAKPQRPVEQCQSGNWYATVGWIVEGPLPTEAAAIKVVAEKVALSIRAAAADAKFGVEVQK